MPAKRSSSALATPTNSSPTPGPHSQGAAHHRALPPAGRTGPRRRLDIGGLPRCRTRRGINARAESGARQPSATPGSRRSKRSPDFDFTAQPSIDRAQIADLPKPVAGSPKPAIPYCLGPPGTGKTHLATALGYRHAAHAGHRVAFAPATGWITRLAKHTAPTDSMPNYARSPATDSSAIDEVGYIPFDTEAANLFFQLVSTRYERSSIILTSNLPFTLGPKSSAKPPSPQR